MLRAWSAWDKAQDAGKRDASIAKAQAKLDALWLHAEARSSAEGVDCAQTTLSSADLGLLVGTAAADLTAAMKAGLDLGDPDDAESGAELVKQAAARCQVALLAESKLVAKPAKDPDRARRDTTRAKLAEKFSTNWDKILAKGCARTATEEAIAAQVDALRDAVITDTTMSPAVEDEQFTTVSPVGATQYEGRAITSVCMNGSPYHYFVKRGTVNKLLVYYQGGGACWDSSPAACRCATTASTRTAATTPTTAAAASPT